MFLIFLSLIIVFIIGYSVSVFFLADKAKKIEIIPMAFVAGLIIMGYFILFAAILSGSFSDAVWIFIVLGSAYSAYYLFRNFERFKNIVDARKINKVFVIQKLKEISWPEVIFFLAFLVFFFDIFSKTIVYEEGVYKVAVAGYGDIPFHMAEVSYFIHNAPFALEEPIYSGVPLVYAFLINLLSSAFYILSGNYILSFNLPAYILFVAGFFFIYKFIFGFIKTAMMRILAFLVFFLGSGAEFVRVFQDKMLWGKSSIGEMGEYILHLPYKIVNFYDAVYPAQNNIWSSFMTMFLTHQRSFFFGFSAGAMVLYIISEMLKNKNKRYLYYAGLLTGLLPLVHMHTFIAVLIIGFGLWIWNRFFAKDSYLAKEIFSSMGVGAAIGVIVSVLFILDLSGGEKLLTFRLGWMSEQGGIGSMLYGTAGDLPIKAWIFYLWENFGLFFPLLVISLAYLFYKKNGFWRKKDPVFGLVFGAVLIFAVINIVKFQPWDYDNGKIFGYFYLLGSVIIIYFFEQWKFKFARVIAVILVFPLIFIGLVDAFSRTFLANPPLYEIFGVNDQKAAKWIDKNILPGEAILTGTSHLNLVNSLAGRPILVGYPGWLWSHGIDYGKREKDVIAMYTGSSETKDLIEKYDIRYVFVGPNERTLSEFNESFFSENYPLVFREGNINIYKVAR